MNQPSNMKKILFLLVTIISFSACQEKKYGAFTVSGKIDNATGKKIFLQELPFGGQQPIILDSGTLKSNGSFQLRGMGKEEGLYRVVIENGPDVLLVNDNKSIKLQMDLNNYRAYQIQGSPASESLHTLFEDYRGKDSALYATFMQLDTLQKQNATDSALSIVRDQRDAQIKIMNTMVSAFINESNSAAARYYALGMASRTMKQEDLLVLANASFDKFKEHSGLAKIKSLLAVQQPAAPKYPLLDQTAPEINLPDVNGKPFLLSSLRGKYVLVDFWASWCKPCRMENPNVVEAYQNYKDKNFTVLGVSLDQSKNNWLQAIQADKLSWTHVSDLQYWNNAVAQLYRIQSIPANLLVDPNGKIIARDIRGEELQRKLKELLK